MVMVDSALLVLVLVLAAVGTVLLAYVVRVARIGRSPDGRITEATASPLLGLMPMEAFHWVMRSLGRLLAKVGASPDALTVTSLVITSTSLPLAATGRFQAAGITLAFGAAFDVLDGIVARTCQRTSKGGALLDSVVDRYADTAPLFGLTLYYHASLSITGLLLATILGAFMTSYVRAKSEAMRLDLPSGVMRRAERVVFLAAALIFGPVARRWVPDPAWAHIPMLGMVGFVGLLSNFAAVHLLVLARRRLAAIDSSRCLPKA